LVYDTDIDKWTLLHDHSTPHGEFNIILFEGKRIKAKLAGAVCIRYDINVSPGHGEVMNNSFKIPINSNPFYLRKFPSNASKYITDTFSTCMQTQDTIKQFLQTKNKFEVETAINVMKRKTRFTEVNIKIPTVYNPNSVLYQQFNIPVIIDSTSHDNLDRKTFQDILWKSENKQLNLFYCIVEGFWTVFTPKNIHGNIKCNSVARLIICADNIILKTINNQLSTKKIKELINVSNNALLELGFEIDEDEIIPYCDEVMECINNVCDDI